MSGLKSLTDRVSMSAAAARTPRGSEARQELSFVDVVAVKQPRSFDPYNTSGSFDRTKNWARVAKR